MNSKCRNAKKEDLFLTSREFMKLLDDIGIFSSLDTKKARLIFRRAQTADDDFEDNGVIFACLKVNEKKTFVFTTIMFVGLNQ